jgi:phosphate transport system substrate-binding protein
MSSDDPTLGRRATIVGAGTTLAALAGCQGRVADGTKELAGGSNDQAGGQAGSGLSGEISVTGSSTVFPLAAAVAEEFQKKHDGVNVSLKSTGSGGGFENFFCPGESDVNNASRPIKDSERDHCADNGVTPHEIRVATDALTVIVNTDNDWATEMTFDELSQIWGPDAGEEQTWSDVNPDWPDETIERYGAAETSGTFDFFTEEVIGEGGAHTQAYQATENDRSIVHGVQGSEYAIGYLGFAYYSQNPDQVTAVAVDHGGDGAVAPSLETAKSGEYPLSRPLFTYPAEESLAEEHVAAFCRYFLEKSTDRTLVADQVGYVPNSQADVDAEIEELEAAIP